MVLVTGGTGFLGTAVMRELHKRDRACKSISLSQGVDLLDNRATQEMFAQYRPTEVVHCAAQAGGIQFGVMYPADAFMQNMQMTMNVIEACRKFNVKKLIHPVSNCVYPAQSTIFRESEIWDGPLHVSVDGYGMARKALITALQAYRRQHGLKSLNLVLPNMYGPGDHLDEQRSHALGGLLLKILHAQKNNLPQVTVWGTGTPIREWLYIDDGARALVRGLEVDTNDDLYNVGSGEYLTIGEIANLLAQEIGYRGEFVYDVSKPDGAQHKQMEYSRFKVEYQWDAKVPLREGIRRTILSLQPHAREVNASL